MVVISSKISLKGRQDSRRGKVQSTMSFLLKFSKLSFLNKLVLGQIQGDLIVLYHSNIAWVWEQKQKETNEFSDPREVQVHM